MHILKAVRTRGQRITEWVLTVFLTHTHKLILGVDES